MKFLSATSRAWLQKDGNLPFAEYFVKLATDRADRKWRKNAIEIAAQWGHLYETGADGQALHPALQALISPWAGTGDEGDPDQTALFWAKMCRCAAAYRFAEIDTFLLTRALYGIYRCLLPEERDIEPFDKMISDKITNALSIDLETAKSVVFYVKNNGLDSELILKLPPEATIWSAYADQMVRLPLG